MTGKNIRMLHSSTREVCSYFKHYHPTEWIANTVSDFVRLRRRRRRGCSSQSGFLEQTPTTTMRRLNGWCKQKEEPCPSMPLHVSVSRRKSSYHTRGI
jgi:hypothetical protein